MVPILEGIEGSSQGRVFALEQAYLTLGRGEIVDIQLTDSGVSRQHAKLIRASDGTLTLVDLASTNGTYVNDARIEIAALREGDCIGIGPDALLRLGYKPREDSIVGEIAGLSPRQLEVARLVAAGITNAEIAAQLRISPRTVTSHLDHIYTRLGISSRAALTRRVIESGALDPLEHAHTGG
jgi:DNA-binding CsgD family transcriptional regulator